MYISLTKSGFDHLFIRLFSICISSSMDCLFVLLSFVHSSLWVVCCVTIPYYNYIPHCNLSGQ